MTRKPGQIMDKKQYKQFVKSFKQAHDTKSVLTAVRDWFDAGGRADETFGQTTVFARVLSAGDEPLIQRALETLRPWTDFSSNLAIREAILAHRADMLKRLLDLGASPSTGKEFLSQITIAASNDALPCIDVLLEHGLSIEDRGTSGLTPLQWIAGRGNGAALAYLLERGADPRAVTRTDEGPMTAMQIARKKGHGEIARLLAEALGEETTEDAGGGVLLRDEIIEPGKVRAAIDEVRESPTSAPVWFGKDIPGDLLDTATATYASFAGDEDPLALIISVSSAKSGFVLTDKALYFGEALGGKQQRIPYGQIKAVEKDRDHLRISTGGDTLDWDLTETLLWENSRRKIADLVSAILEKVLQPEAAPTPADAAEAGPAEAPAQARVTVEIEEPVDWSRVFAFHTPIVLLGMPLIMPAAYALIGASGLAGEDFSRSIGFLGYQQFLTLGAMALLPSMYAFGIRLQFSFGRFLIAAALITFASIQALSGAMRAGAGAVPISLGGGLLGILVASVLGAGGLLIHRLVTGRAADTGR